MVFKAYEFSLVSLANISFMLAVSSFSHHIILSQARTSMISDLHKAGTKKGKSKQTKVWKQSCQMASVLLFKEAMRVYGLMFRHG